MIYSNLETDMFTIMRVDEPTIKKYKVQKETVNFIIGIFKHHEIISKLNKHDRSF